LVQTLPDATAAGNTLDDALATPVEPDGGCGLDTLLELVSGNRAKHDYQLLTWGALLFRGWDVARPADLVRFVRQFSPEATLFDYAGGASPRSQLGGGRYSSTEYPAHLQLALHNELSYSRLWPSRLYFLCLVEPADGGESTLGDSRRILARIDPALIDKMRRKQVRYLRNLPCSLGSGYGWQDVFRTADPALAEAHCRAIGADFEWRGGGLLHLSQIGPATLTHPRTGEEVWFNQADGFHPSALDAQSYAELMALSGSEGRFRLNSSYGDGESFAKADLAHIREAIGAETRVHRWRRGDVLVLDNVLAAHGRMPFRGPRKIALAMT
jgi:Taurine catabolism dioxygenase TauD, TfdA family